MFQPVSNFPTVLFPTVQLSICPCLVCLCMCDQISAKVGSAGSRLALNASARRLQSCGNFNCLVTIVNRSTRFCLHPAYHWCGGRPGIWPSRCLLTVLAVISWVQRTSGQPTFAPRHASIGHWSLRWCCLKFNGPVSIGVVLFGIQTAITAAIECATAQYKLMTPRKMHLPFQEPESDSDCSRCQWTSSNKVSSLLLSCGVHEKGPGNLKICICPKRCGSEAIATT